MNNNLFPNYYYNSPSEKYQALKTLPYPSSQFPSAYYQRSSLMPAASLSSLPTPSYRSAQLFPYPYYPQSLPVAAYEVSSDRVDIILIAILLLVSMDLIIVRPLKKKN